MSTVETGRIGEDAACVYLKQIGYTILRRNYRASGGEIDIIASKGCRLSFVEVKARKDASYGYPAEAVNFKKQQKIRRTALSFITEQNISYEEISFDVCEVYLKAKKINYIQNAF